MTDRYRTAPPTSRDFVLVAFHSEVARLMSLTPEAFAELDLGALEPIVTTIPATSSEVSPS